MQGSARDDKRRLTVKRTLFFKFRLPLRIRRNLLDHEASAPFYEFFGGSRMRCCRTLTIPANYIR